MGIFEKRSKNVCMKKQFIKRVLFFLLVAGMLLSIWKLSLKDCVAPVEQRTRDEWFLGEGAQIRGLRVLLEKQVEMQLPEQTDMTVWITDEEGKTIWEKTYRDVPVRMNEVITLEEFEREKGIPVQAGRYQIHNSLERENLLITYKIYTYNGSYQQRYFVSMALALAFLAVILFMTLKSDGKRSFAVHYFVSFILLGILFSAIMPPLSVPDEESHFYNAYELSSKLMGQKAHDEHGNHIMRRTDKNSVNYLHNAASIGYWYDSFWDCDGLEEMVLGTKRTTVSSTTPDYAYLFSAVGISLARILKMNGHLLILMGRFFNLLAIAAMMAFSVYLIPIGKKFYCVAGLLPEVIYLAASYSYDGLNFALCFLAVAYFFYMIADEKQVTMKNLLIFLCMVLLMIPIKLVYAPFLGLVFLIPPRQLAIDKRLLVSAGVFGILGAGFLLIIRNQDIIVLLKGLDYNSTEEKTAVSLSYMLHNPGSAIFVFASDLMDRFNYYLNSVTGEFVGSARTEGLYELNTSYLPEWMLIAIGILMALGIYSDTQQNTLKLRQRAWVGLLAMASCFLFLLSMYLANNTTDMNNIHGVQGRYFLPVLWLLPIIFGQERKGLAEAGQEQGKNTYLLLMVGMNMVAIFVRYLHLAVTYY